MVTRILFDPRRDLPDGSSVSNPVVVTATPTGIAENGAVVILPTSLTFTIATSADVLQLVPTTASWKWRLSIRDQVTNVLHDQRTVLVPDQPSITYQALPDVDPASLQVTTGAARNWDATFAQLLALLQAVTNASLDDVNSWAPNTAYAAGTLVLNPSQQFVTANQSFTSGSTYNPANWTIQTLNLAGVQALIAQQAQVDSATYPALRATAPDPTKVVAYIDTSVVPPVLKGWNGTAWVAIGGSSGGGTTPDLALTSSGNGVGSLSGSGLTSIGGGLGSVSSTLLTSIGSGVGRIAA